MTVQDIQDELNKLVETDSSNPRIYELIKRLVKMCIIHKRYNLTYHDVDDICHDCASDIYLRIINTGLTVHNWLGFIHKCLLWTYVKNQRKNSWSEIIDTNQDDTLFTSVLDMNTTIKESNATQFIEVDNMVYLEQIYRVVEDVINHTKFIKGTTEWLSLYTSVAFSLCRHKLCYFRLNPLLKPYVQICYVQVQHQLKESGILETVSLPNSTLTTMFTFDNPSSQLSNTESSN